MIRMIRMILRMILQLRLRPAESKRFQRLSEWVEFLPYYNSMVKWWGVGTMCKFYPALPSTF